MKDSYLINFSLFCLKRKFNLLSYLIANENTTYEQFSNLMRSKSVTPPDVSYFNKVKNKALSINLSKEQEKNLAKESEDASKEPVKEDKPKRKRRTRKSKAKTNDNS